MDLRVLKCPNCGANLSASQHARSIDCGFCGSNVRLDPAAVDRARYREAHAWWSDPASHGFARTVSIGEGRWALGPCVARGETSDVHLALRARFPTETVTIHRLRDPADEPRLAAAAAALSTLRAAPSQALADRVPRLIDADARHLVTRWPFHYTRTLAQIGRIPPRPSAWVWRRILEALEFLHRSGITHGAVIPPHVLIEAGEHGARLVGFGNAGAEGDPLLGKARAWVDLYPSSVRSRADDLRMSARTILAVLQSDPPEPLRALLHRVADEGHDNAWALREAVGRAADAAYGRPAFCPILPRIQPE